MIEYILQTFGLTKQYGSSTAVNDINMKIKKGDIYGFIGRNGAGKTTMIRMITGLVEPTKGEIELFSRKDKKNINAGLPRLGSIIEHPALYPNFTAFENMELRSKLLGIPDKKVINSILKTVELSDVGNKKVKNFSLGMRQRLGLALALLGNPDFLILDEPINGLDPEGIVKMRKLLKKLNEEHGITILISSHILGELSKLATRYGIINNGTLVEEFTDKELKLKCRKYLNIKVDDSTTASFVLEDVFKITNYEVLPNNIIKVYDLLDMSGKICLELAKNNVKIYSIESKGDDLEEYFMKLMGGNNYD
ncbi:ATP-binding cassette domain-containing protein [Terrisporobacter petrolearius]|uniref:ATP-binding cassette domain-containing protein n=1 Tax=Terrisporobacter petrolearius TaxID=1460447 RepID=UPI001D163727|nr:ATP-binding cassette domain-containing protein [Terrisporobacter petrolearius]MCC3863770.1 ATP-binding cassette domain-containing protein [Terrisporobacter petrolearius]